MDGKIKFLLLQGRFALVYSAAAFSLLVLSTAWAKNLYLLNKSGQIGEFKNVIPCFSIRCGLVSMKLPGLIEKLQKSADGYL
jgi:hypothetical protein